MTAYSTKNTPNEAKTACFSKKNVLNGLNGQFKTNYSKMDNVYWLLPSD